MSTAWITGSCITGGEEWMVYGNVHEASVFAIGSLRSEYDKFFLGYITFYWNLYNYLIYIVFYM